MPSDCEAEPLPVAAPLPAAAHAQEPITRSDSIASSDDSAGSAADLAGLKTGPRHDGVEEDDDEDEGHGARGRFITGVFGVIYTVSREKDVSMPYVAFKLLIDTLQLLLLTINPQYGFNIQADSTWWFAISFVQLDIFMTSRGFTFFLACLYIFIVMLSTTLALCLWVAWSFKNNRIEYFWHITLLKWFAEIFFKIFDVASLTLLLIALDCNYNGAADPAVMYHNQEFPDKYCWEMPYMIHAMVSAVAAIAFVAMATAFQMGDTETNPLTLNPMAQGHSKARVIACSLKFVMTASSVFIYNLRWLSISYMVCTLALTFVNIKWLPNYTTWVNNFRAGKASASLYSAVMMGVMVILPITDNRTPDEIKQWNTKCTIALVAGLVPAALLGGLAAHFRFRYFSITVVGRYRNAEEGADPELVHKFTDAREVEIAARCCRKWLDVKTLDPQAIELAHTIIKAGSKLVAEQAYMHILHSSFNVDVQHSMQTGLARLHAAKKADPSILDRYAIFSREQQQNQSNDAMDNGNGSDLMSYVQMQRSLRQASKAYKRCLVCMHEFWQTLVDKEVQFEALLKCVSQLDKSIKRADRIYRDIISESLDDWRLIRIYACFLETVKNDPWNSAKWHEEANRLLLNAEETQANMNTIISVHGISGDAATAITDQLDGFKASFLVNAVGVILLANKAALELFGYTRQQMTGRNISIIMPSPFKEQHDKYLKQYVRTEVPTMLGQTNEVVAQHADGHDLPVSLNVAKVSGMSLDSMFLGVIVPIAASHSKARVWVMPDSSIFAAEQRFTDWFGYHKEDMLKQPFTSFIKDGKELERVLKVIGDQEVVARVANRRRSAQWVLQHITDRSEEGNVASGQYLEDKSVVAQGMGMALMKDMSFHHRYSDNVECSLTVRASGIGKHRFFIMEVSRVESQGSCSMMLVVDNTGRIRHVTQDLAEMLGTSVKDLTLAQPVFAGPGSVTFPLDAIIPEAFAALHVNYVAGPVDTRQAPPHYSCRSGLAVTLTNSNGDGPPLLPFQLKVKSKVLSNSKDFLAKHETLHIVNLAPRTMAEALDERRVVLLLDLDGCIQSAAGSTSVFGFDPQDKVGSTIGSLVDVMMGEEDPADHDSFASSVLKDLATRSVLQPGCSFRVGVVPPLLSTDLERFGAVMTSFVTAKLKIPAVMQVSVTWGDLAEGRRLSRAATEPFSSWPSNASHLKALRRESSETNPPLVPMIELSLWKASAVTAVLQLDTKGIIHDTGCSKLYNPGLIFGSDALTAIHGLHIGQLLSLGKQSLPDLFEPELGASKKAGLKSGMKSVAAKGPIKKSGPANALPGSHEDGGALTVNVQATHFKGGVSLVLHITQPCLGMPNFKAWLQRTNMEMQKGAGDKEKWRAAGATSCPVASIRPSPIPSPIPSIPMLPLRRRVSVQDGAPAEQASTADILASELVTAWNGEEGATALNVPVVAELQLGDADDDPRYPAESDVDLAGDGGGAGSGDEDEDNLAAAAKRRQKSTTKVALWSQAVEHTKADGAAVMEQEPSADILAFMPAQDGETSQADAKSKQSNTGSELEADGHTALTIEVGAGFSGDFRRGKRFKRLSRLLGASAVQRAVSHFQFRALSLALAVIVITVACFTVANIRITAQSAKVHNIQDTGAAANAISLVTVDVQNLILLFINFTSPDLLYLASFETDVPYHLGRLYDHALEFKAMLASTYNSVGQLPTSGDPMYEQLSSIWYKNTLNISTLLYSAPNISMDYQMMNLWDAGNFMVNKALDVYQNTMDFKAYVPDGVNYANWSDVRCLLENTRDVIVPAIANTMDVLLVVVLDEAAAVNAMHIDFLIIQGVVCCLFILMAMYVFTTQVVLQRWNTYNTFMVVPMSILRALAARALQNISAGDKERDSSIQAGAPPQDDVLEDGKGAINLTFRGKEPPKDTSVLAIVKATLMPLYSWKHGKAATKVSPASSSTHSRTMARSWLPVALFMSPFAAWGLVMIVVNMLAHQQLALVTNPTALFNLVNYNLVDFYRYYSFMQALVLQPDPEMMDPMRADLGSKYPLIVSDYTAMLRGASAVNDTSPHIALVKEGLTSGVGKDILFTTTDCLCLNQADCVPPSHHLYQYFHHGLDAMLQRYFEVLRTAMADGGLNPLHSSAEFEYIVESYPNIEGGLTQLVQANFRFVTQQYQRVLNTHVIALVVTLLLMVAFVLFLLWPFVRETRAEPRRLAELMSQLPYDVNIEAFVKANLLLGKRAVGDTSLSMR